MKTNQVLTRKMGEFNVLQRTRDGMFNATLLLKEWNNRNPEEKRELDNFWKSTNLDKLMSEIAENEIGFKSVDFTELKKALSRASRGKHNGGTWMNPILYIKFAMYLSPRFEYHVLKFVSDELVKYRNDAGDAYKELSSAIMSLVGKDQMQEKMKEIAKALNHIVFGKHESGMRNNSADERQMRELFELEKKIASLINEGFIASYRDLISYLRKLWTKKWQPPMLRDIEIPARMS